MNSFGPMCYPSGEGGRADGPVAYKRALASQYLSVVVGQTIQLRSSVSSHLKLCALDSERLEECRAHFKEFL